MDPSGETVPDPHLGYMIGPGEANYLMLPGAEALDGVRVQLSHATVPEPAVNAFGILGVRDGVAYLAGVYRTPNGPSSIGGYLWAVRLADQQTVWDYRQPQQLITSALTPTGRGIVLASTDLGDFGFRSPGRVALFETGDSTPRWTRTFPQIKAGLQDPMGRFVCVAGGRVLYISDKPGGLDLATGRDAWQLSLPEARLIDWGDFTVGPDGKTVFIKCLGRFYAIDAASGRVVWEASGEHFGSTSIVADGNLYLTDQGNRTLWAVDPATGKARWKHVLPPPAKHEPKTGLRMGGSGVLMLAAGAGQVYFADPDAKTVTALRATGH